MIILVVDDEAPARYAMAKMLRGEGRQIVEAADGNAAIVAIDEHTPDLVFLDLTMPKKDGLAVLGELAQRQGFVMPEIIVVSANDTLKNAVECVRLGATDFLAKPYDVDHIRSIANRSEKRVRLQHQVSALQDEMEASGARSTLIGGSRVMKKLNEQIARAAKATLPVLIRGESGTGKELVARELHTRSDRKGDRKGGPFVAVNTAAISASLIESELFGHVKGAFTGADRPREGVFRQADGGTLFLDEIGDMPAAVQTRLLRVLQENVVQPVGSEELVKVDVRVLSATHQDLETAIEEKLFRQDLYYRLRGIELVLPPLRQRQEDILLLAQTFIGDRCRFDRGAIAAMIDHAWPGNVRELKQRVESAAAMCDTDVVTAADLGLVAAGGGECPGDFESYFELPLTEARDRLVEDFERLAIERALRDADRNVSAAARKLGIHRQSLQQKMAKLGLRV
jgi:DNA-binding NtrC family response regulator